MKIKSIQIENFRSFIKTENIELSNINIITGSNNSGKSSFIKAFHMLQNGAGEYFPDVRVGSNKSTIQISIENAIHSKWGLTKPTSAKFISEISTTNRKQGSIKNILITTDPPSQNHNPNPLPDQVPEHFIIPYLSKRKTENYMEGVTEKYAATVTSNMQYLSAKLAKFTNPQFPGYKFYSDACNEILGCVVTAVTSDNGQHPGIYLPDGSIISIYQMGEGVPNIVYLLIYLATSENKLFLIEELENDLHPRALKALLELIRESAKRNQFVISTHSNIVVTHLCSEDNSKLFKISSEKGLLPTTANIEEVGNNPRDRLQVLHELGYSFSDYDLWEGWLLLEESSAERIIRDYLIPWFAPKLSRLKTVAAGGIDTVEPMFKDLYRVVLFTHLQQAYSGLAWVRVDGDEVGKDSIQKLKGKFKSIPEDHFSTFDQPQFERYYPSNFQQRITETLDIKGKQEQREAKRILLNDVIDWLDQDPDRARRALEESAISVINELKIIEQEFLARRLG